MAQGVILSDCHGLYIAVFPQSVRPWKPWCHIYRPVDSRVLQVIPQYHKAPIASPRIPCPVQSKFSVGTPVYCRFYEKHDAYVMISPAGKWDRSLVEHWANHSITDQQWWRASVDCSDDTSYHFRGIA